MRFRLAVDLRPLLEPFESGVTIYAKEMLHAFMNVKDLELDLFYQAKNRNENIHRLFPTVRHIKKSNTGFHLRSLFGFPHLPKSYFSTRPDLIWIPDRRPFYKSEIPMVFTIHDFVPELYSWTLSYKSRLWHKLFPLRRLLKLSRGVLCPSETTAQKLPKKVPFTVTFEGANLAAVGERPALPKKIKKNNFFLSISPLDPRKRLEWVLSAAERFPQHYFVIAGVKKRDRRFSKLNLEQRKNIVLLSEISEQEKLWLLKNTCALLALSRYEGFDLPVLEAVKAGTPVILSDISVHHELYFASANTAKNLEDLYVLIYKAIRKDLPSLKSRQELSWEKAAELALLFFSRVIGHKNRN